MHRMTYASFLVYGLRQVIAVETVASVLNGLFWPVLTLVAVGHGFLVFRALPRMDKTRAVLHPLPFLAVFYAVVSAHDQSPSYLFFSVGVTLAGLLWMTTGGSSWHRYIPVALACALSAIALYYHAGQPYPRNLLLGERTALVPSRGLDRASLWMKAADLELYSHLVGLVQRETRPEETILAIPNNPELYFLAHRRNPFRFSNTAVGIRSDDDLKDALGTLAREPPKLVVYRPNDIFDTPAASKIMEFVRRRYEIVEIRGAFEIYR